MPNAEKLAKKNKYFEKLIDLCVNCGTALIVHADHVGSKQMQKIRGELRGKAEVLMGKNTMIRKALSIGHEQHPAAGMDILRSMIKGNIGFIFATHCTLDDIRNCIKGHRMPAAAKAGQISNVAYSLPSGPTGMDLADIVFPGFEHRNKDCQRSN
jgi:large subunit ribosomal protein LP0